MKRRRVVEETDTDGWLPETAKTFALLPEREQRLFIKLLARELGDDRETVFPTLIEEMLSRLQRWGRMKGIMAGWFRKKFRLTPRVVAERYIRYAKWQARMLPFAIVAAQTAKNRVRMERSRAGKTEE